MYEHENEEVAFKVVIYNVALDTLIQEIKSRFETTTKIDNIFSFVLNSRVDSKSSRTIHVLDLRAEQFVEEIHHLSNIREMLLGLLIC